MQNTDKIKRKKSTEQVKNKYNFTDLVQTFSK